MARSGALLRLLLLVACPGSSAILLVLSAPLSALRCSLLSAKNRRLILVIPSLGSLTLRWVACLWFVPLLVLLLALQLRLLVLVSLLLLRWRALLRQLVVVVVLGLILLLLRLRLLRLVLPSLVLLRARTSLRSNASILSQLTGSGSMIPRLVVFPAALFLFFSMAFEQSSGLCFQ